MLIRSGTVVLSAGDSYTGGTTISGGALVLGAAGAAGSGTISFINDPNLDFMIATAPGNVIAGFAAGDTIDITDLHTTATLGTLDPATDKLSIPFSNNGGGTLILQLSGDYTSVTFQLAPDGETGTDVTIACYLRGTRIRTPDGERSIETLRAGDLVITHAGAARPIVFLGRRSYAGRFAALNPALLPVCIEAGALADNIPAYRSGLEKSDSLISGFPRFNAA